MTRDDSPNLGEASHIDTDRPFRVAAWRVEPRRLRVVRGDAAIKVEPRAMQVLLVLARHAGEVVSRDMLFAEVWGDRAVTDDALTRVIFDLRRVFGDAARAPRVIETIPTIGYRLMVMPKATSPCPSPRPSPRPSVAERGPKGWPRRNSIVALILGLSLILGLAAVASLVGFGSSRESVAVEGPPFLPARQLTSLRGYETHPALSPAGDFVVYSRDAAVDLDGGPDGSPNEGNVDLFLRRVDGDRSERLTSSSTTEDRAAFAPDGRRIAFLRTDPGCALMLLDLDSRAERRLAECRDATNGSPSWSPDGATVLYSDREQAGAPYRVIGVDVRSGEAHPWSVPPPDSFGDLYPALSPDGTTLAVVRAATRSTIATYLSPTIGDIVLLDIEPNAGSQETVLTTDRAEIPGLAWSADGQWLIFAANRGAYGYSLWAVARAGGPPVLLHDGQDRLLRSPSVARRRGSVAFESWDGAQDLWMIDLGRDAPVRGQRVVDSTRSDFNPHIAPDGDIMAFTSTRTGHPELWVGSLVGVAPLRRLTRFDGAVRVEGARWSGDGRRLVFEARADGDGAIWRIDTDGGALLRVTEPGIDARAPSWSVDGRRIFFASNAEDGWQVWSVAADGGPRTRETTDGGYASRHGMIGGVPMLFVAHRDRDGVFRVNAEAPVGDRAPARRVADLAAEHWGNWALVGDTIVTVRLVSTPTRMTELWSADVATGTRTRLGVVDGWVSRETPSLSMTPDGRAVVVARFEGLAADLFLLEPERGW